MPSSSVDNIQSLLSAMSVSGVISNSIDETALCKQQLQVLSECVSRVLKALDVGSRSQQLDGERSVRQLEDLHR